MGRHFLPVNRFEINTISGLNGAIPTVWDAGWQIYTDLSPAQIAAFQAMTEWKSFVALFDAWQNGQGQSPSLVVETISAVQSSVSTIGTLK